MRVMEDSSCRKRVRDDSGESELDESEFKRLREDLLFMLDDSDPEHEETQEGLVSVIKSFQEEISAPPSPSPGDAPSAVVDSQPDLGYLFEASDDELGLPPTASETDGVWKGGTELVRVDSGESDGIGGFWVVQGELPNYDAFELGEYETSLEYGHVAFDDGLFEYSNVVYDGTEFPYLS